MCITNNIAGDDVRHLLKAEDEYVVKGRFERIFPTATSYKYLNFMEARYYNRLFDAWEHRYSSNREEGKFRLYQLLSNGIVPVTTKLFQELVCFKHCALKKST